MTTQGIYIWAQIILQVVVGGALVFYIRMLKRAVDAQKGTIEAQAEHLKTQSTIFQDFERLNTMMKHAIDTYSDPVALKREQAFRERVTRDAEELMKDQAKQVTEKSAQDVILLSQKYTEITLGLVSLLANAVPFVPPHRRVSMFDSSTLAPEIKDRLQASVRDAPYALEPLFTSVVATSIVTRTGGANYSSFPIGGGRAFIAEPIPSPHEPQEETPPAN
jgi:hypothetical protein